MAYIFLFGIELFFSYFLRNYKKIGNEKCLKDFECLFFFILILVMTLFYGLRYNVGIDYMSYYNNAKFNLWNKPQRGTGQLFEPGFRTLYFLGYFFELPANTVFVLGGFLIYFFLFLGIKNYSVSFPLSLYIFFATGLYFFSFNEFRQFIAVCVVFYGYRYCVEKKLLKWGLVVFFAMFFHKSAFVVFPMYIVAKIKLSKKIFNTIILGTLIFKKIGMLEILCSVLSVIPGHYSEYAETLTYLSRSSGSGFIGYLYLILLFLINNAKFRSCYFQSEQLRPFINILLFGSIFVNVFADIYMVVRLMEYFLITIVVVFPFYIKLSRRGILSYIFSLFIIAVYLANIVKYSFFSAPENLLAYQTVFSK